MKNILVTGGAGYIGSATVRALIDKGFNVIIVDNLEKGRMELVDKRAKFYDIDTTDKESMEKLFKENRMDAIIHFAGYKAADESMSNAVKYSDNILGTINILNCMVKFGAKKIIFSLGASFIISLRTVSPPKPESKIPIGLLSNLYPL